MVIIKPIITELQVYEENFFPKLKTSTSNWIGKDIYTAASQR